MQSFCDCLSKLEKLNKQYNKLCELLTYEEVVCDKKLCLKLEKEKRELEPIVVNFEIYNRQTQNLKELEYLLLMVQENEVQAVQAEIENVKKVLANTIQTLTKQLNSLNGIFETVTLEINFNKNELAEKLVELMLKEIGEFCKTNAFGFDVEKNKTDVKLNISGLNVKNILSKLVGVHVAKFNGKEENVKVYVYKTDVETYGFNETDIVITATRSSGAGGQHVNTTDSAIKVKHLKSGITVTCQNERSQLQNKNKAIENLKKKVEEFYKNKNTSQITKQKTEQQKLFKSNVFVYDFNTEKIGTILKNYFNF